MSILSYASARQRASAACLCIKACMSLRQGEPASKGAAAPAKKAEPAAKKAPEAEYQPPAPAPAPGKSKHGRKPQRDQQSANQALQLFSHLQQYRVGVPCSPLACARVCRIVTHLDMLCLRLESLAECLSPDRDLERVDQELCLASHLQQYGGFPCCLLALCHSKECTGHKPCQSGRLTQECGCKRNKGSCIVLMKTIYGCCRRSTSTR